MCRTRRSPSRSPRRSPSRNRGLFLGLAAAALSLALGATAPGQDAGTAAYLERLGLVDLLAIELEGTVFGKGPLPEARSRAAERLAEIYPDLLERATDPAARADLERRIDRLLAKQPPKEPEELRLALWRARYRSAARIAEDERVALATPEAIAQARAILEEIARDLPAMRTRLEGKARSFDRRGDNLPLARAERMVDTADRFRVRVAQAVLLEGWARYYLMRLGRETEDPALSAKDLEAATAAFGRIVNTGEAYPQPKDVSRDLRGEDVFAEAILGMALCRSREGSAASAREWLDLLEVPEATASIRGQLPAWRLAIAIDERNWEEAQERLAGFAGKPETPVAWLRLAAVGGLRQRERDARAATLAREAVAALAARRELAQVVDLARRFGGDVFGESGFPARYVAGVIAEEEARAARAAGDEAKARERFGAAAEALERAVLEPDAAAYAASLPGCRSVAAWCRFERGELEAALAGFRGVSDAAAAAGLSDENADWMTIVTLDRLVATRPDDAATAERRAECTRRIDAFLDRHPSSANVPTLLRMRLAAQGVPDRADIDRLLGAKGNGAEAVAARTQAALALYRLFRASRVVAGDAASLEAKAEVGRAFLAAVATLPVREGLPAGQVALVRQAAEIALAEEVRDVGAAAAAIATLETRTGLGAEALMRRVQLAALEGDFPEASRRLAGLLEDPAAEEVQREFARRALFRAAARRFRDEPPTAPGRSEVRAATLAAGEAIVANAIAIAGSPRAALEQAGIESVVALTLAAARESIAEAPASPDAALVARMRPLADALLAKRPKDAATLETLADLALAAGDRPRAAEVLRSLVAGSPAGSERWFRAKTLLIETLAMIDPARARAVLAQHVALQPSYGPEPWGERLRAVERTLGTGGGS
jgi:hypothetical protein